MKLLVTALALIGSTSAFASDFSSSQNHLRNSPGRSSGYSKPVEGWNDYSRSQRHLREGYGSGNRYVAPGGHWNDFSRSQDHLR